MHETGRGHGPRRGGARAFTSTTLKENSPSRSHSRGNQNGRPRFLIDKGLRAVRSRRHHHKNTKPTEPLETTPKQGSRSVASVFFALFGSSPSISERDEKLCCVYRPKGPGPHSGHFFQLGNLTSKNRPVCSTPSLSVVSGVREAEHKPLKSTRSTMITVSNIR